MTLQVSPMKCAGYQAQIDENDRNKVEIYVKLFSGKNDDFFVCFHCKLLTIETSASFQIYGIIYNPIQSEEAATHERDTYSALQI